MTIELPDALGARLAAIAERWGKSPAELAEWLLLPELERIEKNAGTNAWRPPTDAEIRADLEADLAAGKTPEEIFEKHFGFPGA